MAIALGGNSINKAYLGSTEIQKMYLGSELVFDNTVVPVDLKPIMTGFRVTSANPNRVLFDTPLGPVTGISATDFTISGKTISSVNTVDNYFTISTSLNYWDNNTIRKTGGNNDIVYDFTLESISNNIPVPTIAPANYRYIAVAADGGSDSNNGETIGSPKLTLDAMVNALPSGGGYKIWVKAGTYNGENITAADMYNGTSTSPYVIEGYKATPGDIITNYYTYTPLTTPPVLDPTEMPVFDGGDRTTGTFIDQSNDPYWIKKSIQVKGYQIGFKSTSTFGQQILNCNIKDLGSTTSPNGFGIYYISDTVAADLTRIKDTNIIDPTSIGIRLGGSNCLIENTNVIARNGTDNDDTMDYYFSLYGSDSIVKGCLAYKDTPNGVGSNGHGFSAKTDGDGNAVHYNLFDDCEAVGIQASFQARHANCKFNVWKNSIARADIPNRKEGTSDDYTGGIEFNAGGDQNVFENLYIHDVHFGTKFLNSTENDRDDNIQTNALIKNCVFKNTEYFIKANNAVSGVTSSPSGNKYANCTIYNDDAFLAAETTYMFWQYTSVSPVVFGVNKIENCIIEGVEVLNKDEVVVGWTYSYDFSWDIWLANGTPITGTDNESMDTLLDANYQPQKPFTDIDVPKINNVFYGKNGNERQDPTTVGGVLSAEEIPVEPPLYPQSPYTEVVNVPTYDSGNPAHKLISVDADWSNINDPTITSFYVEPGDYLSAGIIQLTADGTSGAKRYISLHNGNDTHPGKIWPDTNSLVQARFNITGDYWVLDRMANWTHTIWSDRTITINGGQNNIINRHLQDNNGAPAVLLFENSHNNTVQNSRTQRDDYTLWDDQPMYGATVGDADNASVTGFKILNNECYNATDAVQLVKSSPVDNVNSNFEGCIVDYNHFYIDELIYSNGSGVQDDNGKYAFSENAIDLKGGSTNPANPVVITNNKMWGFRQSDETGTGLSDNGWAIVTHFDVANVVIEDNVMFDTNKAVGANAPGVETGESMLYTTIKRNIIKDTLGTALGMYSCDNIEIEDNLFVNTSYDTTDFYDWVWDNNNNGTYKNNIRSVIGCGTNTQNVNPVNQDILDNTYWNYTDIRFATDVSDIIAPSDPTANYTDLVFTTDIYTNSPREITVTKVLKP